MKTIIITGANGQLGSDLCQILGEAGHNIIGLTHADADVSNFQKMKELIVANKADTFINTAAFHHVDQCEADLQKAMQVNCEGPAQIADFCFEKGIRFIHFSTDYVFDGKKKAPYLETDIPHPLNNYGLSKWKGEEAILKANPNALILRVSAIYGVFPCRAKNGLNFVQLMLKKAAENAELRVVNDEQVSPTSTLSIAKMVNIILNHTLNGVVHLTSEGSCSWYDFAKEIFDYMGIEAKLSTASSSDFPAKTPRPSYSVLENYKLKQLQINHMPHWKDALHVYLNSLHQAG